jgi:hypothetical protein
LRKATKRSTGTTPNEPVVLGEIRERRCQLAGRAGALLVVRIRRV